MSYNWQLSNSLPPIHISSQEVVVYKSTSLNQPLDRVIEPQGTVYKFWDDNFTVYATSGDAIYFKLVSWTCPSLNVLDAIQFLHTHRDDILRISNFQPSPSEIRVNWTNYFVTPPRPSCRNRTENRHRTYIVPVPFVSFKKSAICMADKDLKLTRVAILRCLRKLNRNPSRQPIKAVEAWRGYEQALIRYGIQIALECKQRGFVDKSLEKLQNLLTTESWEKPKWVYWNKCRESYQSYLRLQDYRRYIWRLLNWFWRIDRYIRRNYCSIHHLLREEWGYKPYNLTFSALRSIEHRVRELVAARQETLSPYVSFYLWPVALYDTICYPS